MAVIRLADDFLIRSGEATMASHAENVREEQRVTAFVEEHTTFSETAASLSNKLGIDLKIVRRVLDGLTDAGQLSRRTFEKRIEPVYYRYHARAS